MGGRCPNGISVKRWSLSKPDLKGAVHGKPIRNTHPPVLVGVSLVPRGLAPPALLKFLLAGVGRLRPLLPRRWGAALNSCRPPRGLTDCPAVAPPNRA